LTLVKTGDFNKLEGLTHKWRLLASGTLLLPEEGRKLGRIDNVGGGVARLDIEVHVLDIVVTVRDMPVIMETQRPGEGRLGKIDCHTLPCVRCVMELELVAHVVTKWENYYESIFPV
jgi:hypothetical protein